MSITMTYTGDVADIESGEKLRSICRKEVSNFEDYLCKEDPQFSEGLARFEKLAIEGYIYQKLKGRLNESSAVGSIHKEGQNGQA